MKKVVHSKAEAAALTVKNMKVKRLNDFYLYHREVIDEFFRLQEDVSAATINLVNATVNTINEKFPKQL